MRPCNQPKQRRPPKAEGEKLERRAIFLLPRQWAKVDRSRACLPLRTYLDRWRVRRHRPANRSLNMDGPGKPGLLVTSALGVLLSGTGKRTARVVAKTRLAQALEFSHRRPSQTH